MERVSAGGVNANSPPTLAVRASRSRADLLHGLKATEDFVRQISAWQAGDLYLASGERGIILNLKANADGSVMGWAQGSDGRFIGQARWTKATTWGSRVVSSAAMLAGHAMLVEISQKLDRIEAKVDRIKQALDDDRRQALKAAIGSVTTALACEPDTARDLLIAAATPLWIAVGQEIQALARLIEQTPVPSRWHAVRTVWDHSPETRRDLLAAEFSFLAVLEGIRALTQLYIGLGEDRAAWTTAHDLLVQLCEAGLQEAWWKARKLLPDKPDNAPEAFWTRAMTAVSETRTYAFACSEGVLADVTVSLAKADLDIIQ